MVALVGLWIVRVQRGGRAATREEPRKGGLPRNRTEGHPWNMLEVWGCVGMRLERQAETRWRVCMPR